MRWTPNLLFVLLLFPTACSGQASLSGNLQLPLHGQWKKTVYLIQPRSLDEIASSFLGQIIDSAQVKADGSFVFPKLPDSPAAALFELVVQQTGETYANKLTNENPLSDNYFPLVWQNGQTLRVSAAVERFQSSFLITNPSPENAALLQLRDLRQKAFQQFMQLLTEEHEEAKLLDAETALMNFRKPLMEFAQSTAHVLSALVALRWVSPNQNYERIPEFLFAQCQKWQSRHSEHPWVAQLCQKSQKERLPVLVGDKMPDIALPMRSGDTLGLQQLLVKGQQLTIVDHWASWCAPCRRENRDVLVHLWDKYHSKGLEIIAYALDASAPVWNKAIEADGAYRWVHASHLQGDDAPLMEALRIQTIPANFLLDAKGKVIAKNLHGEELRKFVAGYLGE